MAATKSPGRPASQGAPPSSPRLPSPPPLPELQLGPRSPSINAPHGELRLDSTAEQDDGAARRVRPGTSAADMAKGPPFVPLHQLESPFQLQEYLKSSYCSVTRDDGSNTVKPISKDTALQLATPPIQQETGEPVDRNLWLYELCRFLVQRTNRVIVSFFADSPPCSSVTCPEMRASEWQYLCAVHEPPKSCCAIDYCCHTLDWAANVLTSTRHFPSRLSLGGEGVTASQSMKQLTNIFRRVYRIYAHAWFQHREAFWMLEQEEGLYKFFKTVSDVYNLIPEDNYTVPPEAEGDREDAVDTPTSQGRADISILRNETQIHLPQPQNMPQLPSYREPEPTPVPVPATPPTTTVQRRHRHTPSTGVPVAAIAEGTEEEEEEQGPQITHISQSVAAEPTATSTTQVSNSPPKPQSRSPRAEMSIPITESKKEDIRAPEDPTPRPERYGSDPFSETARAAAAETVEPPTPLTAVDPSQQQVPPTSKTLMPSLQTDTAAPPAYREDEEIRSPGGGSIRTIGGDILSGILAHVDSHEKDEKEQASGPASTASSDSGWSVIEQEKEPAPAAKDEKEAEKKDDGEDDEEMGEIKLDETATAVKDDSKSADKDQEPGPEKGVMNADARDEDAEKTGVENADGTKAEETPSGVV